jgi:hypothetical protein
MAKHLRADLKAAGVTRSELFERSAVRRPVRVHDLRATFVTISLANGKSETWVADRTGHRSSEMINRYRRQARTWSELGLGELSPLNRALPDLARLPLETRSPGRPIGANLAESKGFEPLVPLQVHLISKLRPIVAIRGISIKQARSAIRDRPSSPVRTPLIGNAVAIPRASWSSKGPLRT